MQPRLATVRILMCLLTVALLALAFFAAYWYPKTMSLDGGTGIYRGFGFVETKNTFLGPVFIQAFLCSTIPEDGICAIDLTSSFEKNGNRFFPFIARYPGGKTRAKGFGRMSFDHDGQSSYIDAIVEGVFYHPNGITQSSVHDGTGVETYWTHEGTKIWELRLNDFKRLELTTWHRNGNLHAESNFRDGLRHGAVEFHDEDGNHSQTIVYEYGLEKERSKKKGD